MLDETYSGGFMSKHIQCTWKMSSGVIRQLISSDGSIIDESSFSQQVDPKQPGLNSSNVSCSAQEDNTFLINEVNGYLSVNFWGKSVLAFEKVNALQKNLRPIANDLSSSLNYVTAMARQCREIHDHVCRYRLMAAVIRSWLAVPATPVPPPVIPLTSAEQQTLNIYVKQFDDAESDSDAVDKAVEAVEGMLKDKAADAIGMSPTLAAGIEISGIILGDSVPNGIVNEAMLVEYDRMTDDQLNAEEARADRLIKDLMDAAGKTQSGKMRQALTFATKYFAACKKAVQDERGLRAGRQGGAAGARDHGTPGPGEHAGGAPGRGADAVGPNGNAMGHDPGSGAGQSSAGIPSFGGILNGRAHDSGSSSQSGNAGDDHSGGTIPGPD